MRSPTIRGGEGETESPAARFLGSARLCRTRDLKQLCILCELVKSISELIHALQKERGASSIYLGSHGEQFAQRLTARITECRDLEQQVRERLEQLDEKLDRMSCGARFYTRVALAFRALDGLQPTRELIATLTMVPQDAVKSFTDIIGSLLAVIFEVADVATDPAISRALLALVNFAQGKEYAGQERATAGAAFSSGHLHVDQHRRLQHLVEAQEQAFRIFSEFAEPSQVTAFHQVYTGRSSAEVKRMREIAFAAPAGELAGVSADAWYEETTRRIDAMKSIEDQIGDDLTHLCAQTLAADRAELALSPEATAAEILDSAPVATVVTDVEPALNSAGLDGGIGLYTLDGTRPKPMRSILTVLQAQSRRIAEVSNQLETARTALIERKVIERAKGLLMASRRLSEQAAYAQIRQTAMNQNKRVFEIAEAIVSMADLLQI